MKDEEFNKLVKKDRYQVFLFSSPASVPICLWAHTWFVVVSKGKVSRWEVLSRCKLRGCKREHLYLNAFSPASGIEVFSRCGGLFWKSKLIGHLEGKKNSVAEKMIGFIENSPKDYPNCDKFSFLGANCNTFTQGVLDKFPGCGLKLPWNASGKNHKS